MQTLELLADLGSTPAGVLPAKLNNHSLDLERQLIGLAVGSPGAIREALQATVLKPCVDLVASLAGDTKLSAQSGHPLPIKQPADKALPFVHLATLLPGHLRLLQKPESVSYVSGIICGSFRSHS